MAKRLIEEPDIYDICFPAPMALVSCADGVGRGNIITLCWVGPVCSKPPMVCIATRSETYSHHLIKATGQFVLNVPNEALLRETDYCGSVSGRDVDKWEMTGMVPLPATRVKAPLIAQSPINMECVVRHVLHLGSHDAFIAEVVAIHVDEGLLKRDGRLDNARVRPLVWFCRQYWALEKEKLADTGTVAQTP